jgi:hypothetical protein
LSGFQRAYAGRGDLAVGRRLPGIARSLDALEAATGLIIAHGTWLARDDDFGCFIHHGAGMAAIDWEAAIGALHAGRLPCSGGERRMLYLAASLADQAPVSLGEAVTGIDDRNVGRLSRRSATPTDDASSLASG